MNKISQEEKEYWVVLSGTPGIGPVTFSNLIKKFGSAKNAWSASLNQLKHHGIRDGISTIINRRAKSIDPHQYFLELVKAGIEPITSLEKTYPTLLKVIKNTPPVLYCRGNLKEEDNKAIAVVGTRKPTSYGRQVASKLVTDLVNEGFTIVSGLARGIDGTAHRTALENGGRTIGFLGGGIDKIYPAEHRGLAQRIIKNGSVISEFPPGLAPDKGNFPARNRLISGMSLGVLIIEGLSKSGTIHTANHAVKQQKPVFAVPGPITSPLSDAPMDLLSGGATMVRSVSDILKKLDLKEKTASKNKNKKVSFDSKEEEIIYKLIQQEPLENNQIIRTSGLDTTTTLTTLSVLEIKGLIKNLSGKYQII